MKIKPAVRPSSLSVRPRAVVTPPKQRVKDELSTGRGFALRANAAKLLGAQGLSSTPVLKAAVASPTSVSMHELDESMNAIDHARNEMKALDQRVAVELQELEGMLTPEQEQAYRDAFREQHGYAKWEEQLVGAEADLSELASRPGFLEAMQQADPTETHTVYAALNELADGPHAAQVLELLGKLDGADLFQGTGAVDGKRALIERTASSLFTQELAKNPDDPQAAVDAVVAQYAPFMGDAQIAAKVNAFQTVVAAKSEDEAVRLFEENAALLGDELGAATYIVLTTKASLGAINVTRGVGGVDGLASLFTKGLVTDGIAVRVCETIGHAAKLPGATAKLIGRLMPALTGVLSGVGRLLQDDKNAGTWIGIAGDALATAGGVMMASVVGAPIGFIAAGVGSLISVAGSIVETLINSDQRAEDRDRVLEQLVNDGSIGEYDRHYINERLRWPRQVSAMENWGLSRQQVVELIDTHPELLTLAPHQLAAFSALLENYEVGAADVQGFFDVLAKESPNYAGAAALLFENNFAPTVEEAQVLIRDASTQYLEERQRRATYSKNYGGL